MLLSLDKTNLMYLYRALLDRSFFTFYHSIFPDNIVLRNNQDSGENPLTLELLFYYNYNLAPVEVERENSLCPVTAFPVEM